MVGSVYSYLSQYVKFEQTSVEVEAVEGYVVVFVSFPVLSLSMIDATSPGKSVQTQIKLTLGRQVFCFWLRSGSQPTMSPEVQCRGLVHRTCSPVVLLSAYQPTSSFAVYRFHSQDQRESASARPPSWEDIPAMSLAHQACSRMHG